MADEEMLTPLPYPLQPHHLLPDSLPETQDGGMADEEMLQPLPYPLQPHPHLPPDSLPETQDGGMAEEGRGMGRLSGVVEPLLAGGVSGGGSWLGAEPTPRASWAGAPTSAAAAASSGTAGRVSGWFWLWSRVQGGAGCGLGFEMVLVEMVVVWS